MTRLWLLTAVLLALALAGCGPDCQRYCNKLEACAAQSSVALEPDPATYHANCLAACDAGGGDKKRTIDCVIDTADCAQLAARCTPTGGQYPP